MTTRDPCLTPYTDDQLRAELARRAEEARKKPAPVETPDFGRLRRMVIECVANGESLEGAAPIVAEAIRAVYGGDRVFEWMAKRGA